MGNIISLWVWGRAVGAVASLTIQALTTTEALKDIRSQKKGSVIILSFRNLQRLRIENLQQDLLNLTQKNLESHEGKIPEGYPSDPGDRQDVLNREMDAKLHVYGA